MEHGLLFLGSVLMSSMEEALALKTVTQDLYRLFVRS
jgi:hypothetical protein